MKRVIKCLMSVVFVFASLFYAVSANASNCTSNPAPAVADTREERSERIQFVLDTIKDYEALAWDKVADRFTENGRLHSVMRSPIETREGIRARLHAFHTGIECMRLDVLHIAEVDGVVMVERMDNWRMNGEDKGIPAVGVLEFEDGLIVEWREYYDLDSLKREMGIIQ